jgi:putative tricarboxylic transport membrane protein
MRTYDRASAVFWFFLSTVVLVQSIRMGVGTLGNPGMGFMACGASGIMALLSLILLVQSFVKKKGAEEGPVHPFAGLMLRRVVGFVIAVFLYIIVLPPLGYLIATFLLMASLLVIVGRRKWWLLILFPALSSLVSYYVFAKLFHCPFPTGIFSF